MKKTLLCALLAATFAAPAVAGDTATLAVTALVTGTCKFTSTSFAMDFGTLDPSAAALQNKSTALTYKCTKGLAPSFSFDALTASPATVTMTNGTDNIPVQLTWTMPATVGAGFGAGTDQSLTVNGAILAASYANASAGNYLRSVALVVAP